MKIEEIRTLHNEKLEGTDIPRYGYFDREMVTILLAEIDRLLAGKFTEEEFQNLCHNTSEDDACKFAAGCREYNRKLFGDKSQLQGIIGA